MGVAAELMIDRQDAAAVAHSPAAEASQETARAAVIVVLEVIIVIVVVVAPHGEVGHAVVADAHHLRLLVRGWTGIGIAVVFLYAPRKWGTPWNQHFELVVRRDYRHLAVGDVDHVEGNGREVNARALAAGERDARAAGQERCRHEAETAGQHAAPRRVDAEHVGEGPVA